MKTQKIKPFLSRHKAIIVIIAIIAIVGILLLAGAVKNQRFGYKYAKSGMSSKQFVLQVYYSSERVSMPPMNRGCGRNCQDISQRDGMMDDKDFIRSGKDRSRMMQPIAETDDR